MNTKRRALSGAMALALAGGAVVTTALPTGAAEQELILALATGQIQIVDTPLPLPDGDPEGEGTTTFIGTWDDVSGAVNGTLTVPTINLTVASPLPPGDPLPVQVNITQTGGGTGTIDPATGDGTVDITVQARISSPDPAIGPLIGDNCVLAPINLSLTADAQFDADPVIIGMTQNGFFVPGASGCGADGALNGIINTTLGIGEGTENTSASLRFLQTDTPPPPPTTTTTVATTSTTAPTTSTTARPAATAARPVAARPAYTG